MRLLVILIMSAGLARAQCYFVSVAKFPSASDFDCLEEQGLVLRTVLGSDFDYNKEFYFLDQMAFKKPGIESVFNQCMQVDIHKRAVHEYNCRERLKSSPL